MARRDDTKVSSVVIVGLLGVLGVFVVMVLLQVLYFNALQQEERAKIVNQRPEEVALVHADELSRLQEYRWVNRQQGIAAIPIDRAMDLVVEELAAGKPLGGAPLPPPPEQPSPAEANP